jgi:hypothetical protein
MLAMFEPGVVMPKTDCGGHHPTNLVAASVTCNLKQGSRA